MTPAAAGEPLATTDDDAECIIASLGEALAG